MLPNQGDTSSIKPGSAPREKQHSPLKKGENRKEKETLEFPILLRWNSSAILSLLRGFYTAASFFFFLFQEGKNKQDGISLASKCQRGWGRAASSHLPGEGIPLLDFSLDSFSESGKKLIHNKPRAVSEFLPKKSA